MDQLVRQLKGWQARERFCRLAWGLSRWAAVVLAGLAAACLMDWTIDRYRDTPMAVRILLAFGQLALFAVAAVGFLFRLRVPSLDVLAGRAERAYPEFDHRLVTALQLNRPTAKTAGMSPQLIADLTREASDISARHDLRKLTETHRLKKAVYLLLPLVAIIGGLFAFNPKLILALLARQAFVPGVEIPRSVAIAWEPQRPAQPDADPAPDVWPSGDPVKLAFRVTGKFTENSVGTVAVRPEGQPTEHYDLRFAERIDDSTARFVAEYPPASVPFTFHARLHDGRTRKPGEARFEPRPVVKEVRAWLRLPLYVDPERKRRYEVKQEQGEVTALVDSGVRIEATATKPVKAATLVMLKRTAAGAEEPIGDPLPMALDAGRTTATLTTEISAQAVAYRVHLTDDNEFANLNPPRRGIGFAPDEPPRVNLLPEVLKDPRELGPIDDYEVAGMPLVLGGRVQIGYTARSPLGLDRAYILYRVNESEAWTPLPLTPTVADPAKLGRFLPELGVFENSGEYGQVEFYRVPSPDLESEPPGLEGGGRYNFETGALKKFEKGQESKLMVGDRVEFLVGVYDRNPDPKRPQGRSESRIKAVVTLAQLEDWNRQRDQSRERLRQLEERQRGVFGRDTIPPASGTDERNNPFRRP
ncbi:hypothetical protein [Limnoglobus roseus]|uniref:Uncharacterized protein n=1 Tax=Limnoglobus roseus TaxID=2598579 RepID=A0A5C1AIY7_9BACT|nr:hypothetical protein [Limnoglobus roseus]QEL18213.1 hypothetical protein PX52LOC_05227 [Limnoglobus roseus]